MSMPRRRHIHYAKHRVFWPHPSPFRLTKTERTLIEKMRRVAKANEKIDEARRQDFAEKVTAGLKLDEDKPL